MPEPAPNWMPADGNGLPTCSLFEKNSIFSATNSAPKPMIACSACPSIISAILAPTKLPMTNPSAILRHTSQRTPPRLLCAVSELIEVTTMVANDVPMARWVITSGEKSYAVKIQTNAGTIIMPPPTPNKPALTPANAPAITNHTYNIIERTFYNTDWRYSTY